MERACYFFLLKVLIIKCHIIGPSKLCQSMTSMRVQFFMSTLTSRVNCFVIKILYRNIRVLCLLTQICAEKVKFMISIITVFNRNMAVYIVAIDRKDEGRHDKNNHTRTHSHTADNVCSRFRINGLYT